MNIPYRRLQRISNPFNSEDSNNNNESHQQMYNQNKPTQYFSNVFQYNDRSKVTLSDSQISSYLSNNESGQNIYTFSKYPKPQIVQQIPNYEDQLNFNANININNKSNHNIKVEQSISSDQNIQEDIRFSFKPNSQYTSTQLPFKPNPQYTSPEQKNIVSSKYVYSTVYQQSYKNQSPNKVTFEYQSPQNSKFHMNDSNKYNPKVSTAYTGTSGMQNSSRHSDLPVSNFEKTFTRKNTFKPSLLIGKRSDSSSLSKQNQSPKGIKVMNEKQIPYKIQKQNLYKVNNQYLQNKNTSSYQSQLKHQQQQQVQKQHLQVFERTHSVRIPKNNMLTSLKHDLSKGNKISIQQSQHSYHTNFIHDIIKKQNYQHKSIHKTESQSQNSQEKDQQIVTSHFYLDGTNTKNDKNVKKRKKIFGDKEKYSINKYSNQNKTKITQKQRQRQNNHISHSNNADHHMHQHQQIGCPHTQCLIKSLQIIDKLATPPACKLQQKPFIPPHSSKMKKSVLIPSHVSQQPIYNNKKSQFESSILSSEQLKLRQQILQINFQLTNFETLFDLQIFDSKQSYQKLLWLNQSSIKLFQRYKHYIMTLTNLQQSLSINQTNQNVKLKQQVLNIREKVSKLIKWHEKYIQSKQILLTLQTEIKQVLLLSPQQKYKKIKLLNQVITVLQKTETYLTLQTKTIPTIIKNYIQKEKQMIEELRQWLKNCFQSNIKK